VDFGAEILPARKHGALSPSGVLTEGAEEKFPAFPQKSCRILQRV
jgi:hypothetical protein